MDQSLLLSLYKSSYGLTLRPETLPNFLRAQQLPGESAFVHIFYAQPGDNVAVDGFTGKLIFSIKIRSKVNDETGIKEVQTKKVTIDGQEHIIPDIQLDMVGGTTDNGETSHGTAMREANEEVGIRLTPKDLTDVFIVYNPTLGKNQYHYKVVINSLDLLIPGKDHVGFIAVTPTLDSNENLLLDGVPLNEFSYNLNNNEINEMKQKVRNVNISQTIPYVSVNIRDFIIKYLYKCNPHVAQFQAKWANEVADAAQKAWNKKNNK